MDGLGEQVGQAGEDRLSDLGPAGSALQDLLGGLAVAPGEGRIGLLGYPVDPGQRVRRDRLAQRNLMRAAGRVGLHHAVH